MLWYDFKRSRKNLIFNFSTYFALLNLNVSYICECPQASVPGSPPRHKLCLGAVQGMTVPGSLPGHMTMPGSRPGQTLCLGGLPGTLMPWSRPRQFFCLGALQGTRHFHCIVSPKNIFLMLKNIFLIFFTPKSSDSIFLWILKITFKFIFLGKYVNQKVYFLFFSMKSQIWIIC